MIVEEFRFLTTNDVGNDLFNDGSAWSRYYEYEMVLERMSFLNSGSLIHNTSWGGSLPIHTIFKNALDNRFTDCLHTDIRNSEYPNTKYYDITEKPKEEWLEKFDCVLNISTLEEVGGDHRDIFKNLYSQVKKGGKIICTFDYPGLQINNMEKMLEVTINRSGELLTGNNSIVKNGKYAHLNCGILVVRK